MNISLSSQTS